MLNKQPDKIGVDRGTQIFPCKIFDKDMNLVRIISVVEVQAIMDDIYKKITWRQKETEYKNRYGNSGNRK